MQKIVIVNSGVSVKQVAQSAGCCGSGPGAVR